MWVGMSRGRFVGGRNVKAPVDPVVGEDNADLKGQSHKMFQALFKCGLIGLGHERNRRWF